MAKSSTDISAILREKGIPSVSLKRGWVNIRCPFCHDDEFHGGFNVDRGGYYTCWRCGGHRVEEVLVAILGLSWRDAADLVRSHQGHSHAVAALNNRQTFRPGTITMPGDEFSKVHRRYLTKRRFDPNRLTERYGLRGTGIAGRWKYRIMIPIRLDGRLVAYQGRALTNQQKERYLSSSPEESVIEVKELLYNLDNCVDRRIVLVEGVTDVWRLGDGTAATLGTSMTEAKLGLLADRYDEVLFLFDPEPLAMKRAREFGRRLASLGLVVELIQSDYDHDPAKYSDAEVAAVRAELGLPLGGEYQL